MSPLIQQPTTAPHRDPADDAAWADLKSHWDLRSDTIYLNHGSFGPPPREVRQERDRWQRAMDSQPMNFFVRQLEPALLAARNELAGFVNANPQNLIFVENATVGMNIIADSFPLKAGDEVFLTDHEYGAVQRIWLRACQKAGAVARTVTLPLPFQTVEETVAAFFDVVHSQTRLIVVSHVTSPTAVILPVAEICRRAFEMGIAVAIDGPHAVAQVPLALDKLHCDFYTASCHKWLSAPFGSGFLYVAPGQQSNIRPPVLSWGRLPPGSIGSWGEEFFWSGTRNPSSYLAVPSAITFLNEIGLDQFRARTNYLARYARGQLLQLSDEQPIVPDGAHWYGSMAHVPLPPPRSEQQESAVPRISDAVSNPLQRMIWQRFGIEVPIVEFRGQRYVRVSCHLYNDRTQIDQLVASLKSLLAEGE